jgi:hypothetical protein
MWDRKMEEGSGRLPNFSVPHFSVCWFCAAPRKISTFQKSRPSKFTAEKTAGKRWLSDGRHVRYFSDPGKQIAQPVKTIER